jgi:hypothetical protein
MRTLSFAAVSLLACSAAFGATRPETATYVDGNIASVSPNSGGTLDFSDESAINFKTSSETVAVPYAGISKTELGVTKVHSHSVPMYKVWSLQKRFSENTRTQLLTLGFKNADGEDKTMTLELAQPAAKNVLATIRTRTAKNATPVQNAVVASAAPTKPATKAQATTPSGDEWWGDQYWKTTRNTGKWNKPAGTTAAEQQ